MIGALPWFQSPDGISSALVECPRKDMGGPEAQWAGALGTTRAFLRVQQPKVVLIAAMASG